MTRYVDQLSRAHTDIEQILARSGRQTKVDLARAHIDEWIAVYEPGTSGDPARGGSSSPVEASERLEDHRVHRQACHDHERLPILVAQIETATRELYRLVVRNVETIHPSKRPADVTPVCTNPRCDKTLDPSRRSGECGRCRTHRHRHGMPYPLIRTAAVTKAS